MKPFHQRGTRGEDVACQYLINHGYTILARNFRLHHAGEIDIIAIKGRYAACVEVKTRYKPVVAFEYLVTWSKQQKIIKTAHSAIRRLKLERFIVRFDVLFVDVSTPTPEIRHIESAFMQE